MKTGRQPTIGLQGMPKTAGRFPQVATDKMMSKNKVKFLLNGVAYEYLLV
jgi:hypothetical protein